MRRCIVCSAIVMICLAPAVTAADPPIAVRVFNLHYTSVAEASFPPNVPGLNHRSPRRA